MDCDSSHAPQLQRLLDAVDAGTDLAVVRAMSRGTYETALAAGLSTANTYSRPGARNQDPGIPLATARTAAALGD